MNKTSYSFLKEIIKDFDILIENIPGNAFNYCSRGILKFSIDDIDGAWIDWDRASRMGCNASCFLMKEMVNGKAADATTQTKKEVQSTEPLPDKFKK